MLITESHRSAELAPLMRDHWGRPHGINQPACCPLPTLASAIWPRRLGSKSKLLRGACYLYIFTGIKLLDSPSALLGTLEPVMKPHKGDGKAERFVPLFEGQGKKCPIALISGRYGWLSKRRAVISGCLMLTSHCRHGWKTIITLLPVSGVFNHSCKQNIPARSITSYQTGWDDIPFCTEQAKLRCISCKNRIRHRSRRPSGPWILRD